MNLTLTRAVLPCAVAVLVLASAASKSSGALVVPTAGDERFGWDDSDLGAAFAEWAGFAPAGAITGPFSPTSSTASSQSSGLTEHSMTGFVTSTGAIYSFSAATEISTDVKTTNLSGTQTRVVAQIQASGTGLDLSSLLLNGQTASVSGIADSRTVTSFGGPTLQSDYMAIWDIAASPLDDYSLAFNSLGPHMSLEAVRIDAFASDTAFVTPASVTAVPEPASVGTMLALTCGGGVRWLRRRKSSVEAKRS